MKTNVITESKNITKKNAAMLLVGFLTPVILFSSLTVSLMNSGSAAVKEKTAQKYAVNKVYLTDEMCISPKVYIYKQDGTDEEITITFDNDSIRLRDALLPTIGRF